MSKGTALGMILLVSVVAVLALAFSRKTAAPPVDFVKTTRETIVSTLNTNGKVEPIEWASARAERQGVVERVFIQKGQQVGINAPLVSLDMRAAAADVASAEARIAQATAEGQIIERGGSNAQLTEIENNIAKFKLELQVAQKDFQSLQRLQAKQAASQYQVDQAKQLIDSAQLQIQAFERKRETLVGPTERPVAAARLHEAQATAVLARRTLSLSVVRAPIGGTVYQFDLRRGSYVGPGDLVANVGRLDRVRVTVYVDEPDLGRVAIGMPVSITWDARPGQTWKGSVERVPTQVVPLGTRQVGEVSCVIDNPERDLLPGTNINAEIRSRVVPNALTIPKEALRRQGAVPGVYLLSAANEVKWRPIQLGVSSVAHSQVVTGLKDGDAVALPTDKPIKDGFKVEPRFP